MVMMILKMKRLFALSAILAFATQALAQINNPAIIPSPGFAAGPPSPVAGVSMQVDGSWANGTPNCAAEGGIWPTNAYAGMCFSKTFTALNTTSGAGSPATALMSLGVNNGSLNDVLGFIGTCKHDGASATGSCFGANVIARTSGGINNKKLVGLEIDIEPEAGVTVNSGSAGIYINAFNAVIPVVMQIGALGGGSWGDGIIFDKISGAYIAPKTGATTATTGADWRNGTFSDAAIHLGNQQLIKLDGSNGLSAVITTDNNQFLVLRCATKGCAVRNQLDTVNLAYWDDTDHGNFNLPISGQKVVGVDDLNLKAATGSIVALSPLRLPVVAVLSLPTCNAGAEGTLMGVNDATATTFHSIVATGGGNHVLVYCNGTNWVIGG